MPACQARVPIIAWRYVALSGPIARGCVDDIVATI